MNLTTFTKLNFFVLIVGILLCLICPEYERQQLLNVTCFQGIKTLCCCGFALLCRAGAVKPARG